MKIRYLIATLLSIPVIAWLPAQFWSFCGKPWCLRFFPEWLDAQIYAVAKPYLDADISLAAEQMEFLETWISSIIIMQAGTLLLYFLFKDKFEDDF